MQFNAKIIDLTFVSIWTPSYLTLSVHIVFYDRSFLKLLHTFKFILLRFKAYNFMFCSQ